MKRCYLDSNFLVYLKDNYSIKHKIAAKIITNIIAKDFALHITPLVLDEFLYVYKFSLLSNKVANYHDELRRAISEILDLPQLSLINPPIDINSQLKIVEYMKKYNLKPRDAYHLLTMLHHGIDTFATFDNDFRKVFAAKILKKI